MTPLLTKISEAFDMQFSSSISSGSQLGSSKGVRFNTTNSSSLSNTVPKSMKNANTQPLDKNVRSVGKVNTPTHNLRNVQKNMSMSRLEDKRLMGTNKTNVSFSSPKPKSSVLNSAAKAFSKIF